MKSSKNVIFIVVSIILIFIILGIVLNILTMKNRIASRQEIVKGMSESTQVSELQVQLTNLEKEKEEYATKVQNYKASIAQAITNKGVETASDATFETITENIGNIQGENVLKCIKLGSTGTFDVSSYTGYENFTTANFFTIVTPPTSSGMNEGTCGYCANGDKVYWKTTYTAPSVSYNASTGKVTVTGSSYKMEVCRGSIGSGYGITSTTVGCTVTTYLVYCE